MRVRFKAAPWMPRELGDYMVELLEDLGYRVRDGSGKNPQMFLGGWVPDYPAASSMFVNIFTCDAIFYATGFCDPRIDAMIDHALEVQTHDPVAAGALWAEIDRAIVDQALYLWLVNPIDVVFVSERVDNYQSNSVYGTAYGGLLLDQLWLR
jgi:peptide/nickel transport system substrate-binding protein